MYDIEIKPAPKQSWFTPAEARNYYGRYDRSGITIHWWGGGETADKHDSIVNYFLAQGAAGVKSVNYVLSDNKITLMVNPDDVAWASQSGNPTTVSVEIQPTLGTEGYKKAGWLIWQIRQRYGRSMPLYPHKYWFQTECPGTLSLDRMEQEAQKWAAGFYNAQPEWEKNLKDLDNAVMYTEANAPLTDVRTGAVIKTFPADTPIEVSAETTYGGSRFLLSEYSFSHHIPNAIPAVQLKPQQTPVPTPTPTPQPEWVTNLQDIDDTKYYLSKDSQLWDIAVDKPASPGKQFHTGDEFVASAKTRARNQDFVITDYSYKKGVFNGLPTTALSLTPPIPPLPPTDPTPTPPPSPVPPVDSGWIITALQGLIAAIQAIIDKLRGK